MIETQRDGKERPRFRGEGGDHSEMSPPLWYPTGGGRAIRGADVPQEIPPGYLERKGTMLPEQHTAILRAAFPEISATDPAGFLGEAGSSVDALLYGAMYWPEVFEYAGAVFVGMWGDDRAETVRRLTSPQDNVAPLSWVDSVNSFNIFEVHYFFRAVGMSDELDRDAEFAFAQILVESWNARLLQSFPARRFKVDFWPADEQYEARISVIQLSPDVEQPANWDPQRRFLSNET